MYLGDGITFVLSGLFVIYTKNAYLYLITLGAVTIICVAYLYFTFPESPKFLYSKRRFDELEHSLEDIKRWNRIGDDVSVKTIMDELKEAKSLVTDKKSTFIKDLKILYSSHQHKRSLYAVCALWIYSAFNYYLIGYYVKYFPGDVFVNFMTMTVAEIIAPITLRLVQN